MKARKKLYLSVAAVARGERLAKSRTSLSELVEKQLRQIPEMPGANEDSGRARLCARCGARTIPGRLTWPASTANELAD
jgi:hypothetical protein